MARPDEIYLTVFAGNLIEEDGRYFLELNMEADGLLLPVGTVEVTEQVQEVMQ